MKVFTDYKTAATTIGLIGIVGLVGMAVFPEGGVANRVCTALWAAGWCITLIASDHAPR